MPRIGWGGGWGSPPRAAQGRVAVTAAGVRIPGGLGACHLPGVGPFPGVCSAVSSPQACPWECGRPLSRALKLLPPTPSSTPAFLFCISHFLPQPPPPPPPRCVEEDDPARADAAPALPRKVRGGERQQ
ncbi:costars family protein ABRACL isoform X2 [Vulpes lagopus]|uniref:costars family protein ABRACL isoform X2 n=1 Tax=Vulpes lagopus TaxID=494514 RepID=UPI001BC9F69A|nr:costars family protein ABRACL isoform X2 [Vulpes lagopus]